MENIFLRAKRNFDDTPNYSAPEYADNRLDVTVYIPQGAADVKEMSIRIYSAERRFMGTGCITRNPRKLLKKACFSISNDDAWEAGAYYIYVYVNGNATGFCKLYLPYSWKRPEKASLEALSDCPTERFFVERLAMTGWWPKVYGGRFKAPLVNMLIERLMTFSTDMEEHRRTKVPHLLVTSEGEQCGAKAMASMLLAGFITGDDISRRYNLSLEEITTGAYGWKHMADQIAQSKAVVVEVPKLKYNAQTENIVNLIASIIRYDTFRDTTFVVHGTEENIGMMMEKCCLMKELFTEETTFRLSADRSTAQVESSPEEDNDDEFMKLVEEMTDREYECEAETKTQTDTDTEEDECTKAEKELNGMVGLQRVKDDIGEARMMAAFNLKRMEMCLQKDSECRNHMLFLGNPGTGKTTVAKLIGKMYHGMGLLSKGHTVETNRAMLVGEYIGMTEKNTMQAIEDARGGVLFIDEAYTLLTSEDDTKDFGKEVINALLTVLSEPEPDMIVIMAGYEDKMARLLRTNPGLKDRFPLTFHFDDYSADELMEIACRMLRNGNYQLTDTAHKRLAGLMEKATEQRDAYFGNGRWVHNLIYQGIIKSMARRVMTTTPPDGDFDAKLLCRIEETDILEAERNFLRTRTGHITAPRPIGFRA